MPAIGSTQEFTGFNRALECVNVRSVLYSRPVIYLSAIESNRYNWASPIEAHKLTFKAKEKLGRLKNYSGGQHGIVPMMTALANSYNLSAVRLGQEFGMSTFINHLKKFGVTSTIPNYPSIYLGAVDMSPLEVMSILATLQQVVSNTLLKPFALWWMQMVICLIVIVYPVQPTIDPSDAYILNYGLQQVMRAGTGRSAYATLPSSLGLAGRSGTTNDTRDSWFAGYSGNYATVVWLGLDNNKATGLTGSSGALPVWTNVMKQLRQKPVNLRQPDAVTWQWIDSGSGDLSASGCNNAVYIPLNRNSIPTRASACAAHNMNQNKTQLISILHSLQYRKMIIIQMVVISMKANRIEMLIHRINPE